MGDKVHDVELLIVQGCINTGYIKKYIKTLCFGTGVEQIHIVPKSAYNTEQY